MIKEVSTTNAPQAIGPYAQAVRVGGLMFISGQLPIDPQTGKFTSNDIVDQTKQVMKNIEAILKTENLNLNSIAKTNIFVKDLGDFNIINETYADYLGEHRPARAVVEISRLPKDAQIEIEAIAYIGQ